ncbi:MAG TPA: sigma-E factor negative regulatory protein [Steroidobacteraceae bacterium]|jgi:negative regulator of sigma E activity
MNNEELDSQLSAMFDDELPEPECELLARRLARDEGLKARWGRYAVIAACLRMERDGEAVPSAGSARASGAQVGASSGAASAAARPPGREDRLPPIRLHGDLAGRVSRAIAAEPALLAGTGLGRSVRGLAHPVIGRWWQPVAGGAVVAASVAAAAILWLRAGAPDAPVVAQTPILTRAATPLAPHLITPANLVQVATSGGNVPSAAVNHAAPSTPDSFVVPPSAPSSSFAPPIELANFMVVHSEYSMPLPRRSALSAVVADEPSEHDAAENSPASDRSSSGADEAGNAADAPHADPSH